MYIPMPQTEIATRTRKPVMTVSREAVQWFLKSFFKRIPPIHSCTKKVSGGLIITYAPGYYIRNPFFSLFYALVCDTPRQKRKRQEESIPRRNVSSCLFPHTGRVRSYGSIFPMEKPRPLASLTRAMVIKALGSISVTRSLSSFNSLEVRMVMTSQDSSPV